MIGTAATRTAGTADEDHVILLDSDGSPLGLAPRATVHSVDTPLHLAFSCHLVREDGSVAAHAPGALEAHLARSVDQRVLRPPTPG
ncbi:hypothetical protein [Brachybacterium sp. GPGPB12]|uniref:hypothetical protein n=1 Tax=Brachybacterium sp. GPGPB12 TaxID=3023517 RepID=UPI0031345601